MALTVSDTEGRLRELKSVWSRLEKENDDIVATANIENGVVMIDNARRAAFQKNVASMREIKDEMSVMESYGEMKQWGSQPAVAASNAAFASFAAASGMSAKTIGKMFTESDEFKNLAASRTFNMSAPWTLRGVDMGSKVVFNRGVEQKNIYSTSATGGPPLGFAPLQRDPVVVQAFRKVRVRDLFQVTPTTAAVIEFFRVTGFVQNNAASTVAEWDTSANNFGLAPHTSLNFTGTQAPVRSIRHWEAAHRNVLDDVPQLQGIIDTELLYGLRLEEDNQILNGTGNGSDIQGLMTTAGVQSYTRTLGTDTKADDVRRAATKVILSYYEPTGVVVHPSDWEAIELLKDTTGAYIVAIAVALGGEQRIWRLPVVDTPSMNQGQFLLGAFGLGATLYDREEGSIRIAEQHADFFLRDAIVVLAEERIALATKRPESFVAGTFGA